MPVPLEALLTPMGKGCRLIGRAESPKLDLREGSVEIFVDIKPFRVEKRKLSGITGYLESQLLRRLRQEDHNVKDCQ